MSANPLLTRIEGFDAPTLKESGLDVEVQNWRMVAAAPGITEEQKAAGGAGAQLRLPPVQLPQMPSVTLQDGLDVKFSYSRDTDAWGTFSGQISALYMLSYDQELHPMEIMTFGVEEEFLLLDPATGRLTAASDWIPLSP